MPNWRDSAVAELNKWQEERPSGGTFVVVAEHVVRATRSRALMSGLLWSSFTGLSMIWIPDGSRGGTLDSSLLCARSDRQGTSEACVFLEKLVRKCHYLYGFVQSKI